MLDIETTLVKMVELGALRVAPAGPEVVLCPLCGHSVLFHADGCMNDPDEMAWVSSVRPVNVAWPLPQAVAQACIERGVVIDDDLLRFDMQGQASFAPVMDIDYGDPCATCPVQGCDGSHCKSL